MSTWVAFLRGINVGGHRKLPMADLKSMHATLGHENVKTYIASGNVLFEAAGTKPALEAAISQAITKRFDYDVPVVVVAEDELRAMVEACPFSPPGHDPKKIGLAFAHGPIPAANRSAQPTTFGPGDEFELGQRVAYLHYGNGMSKTKMSTAALEKMLGVPCTVRNWNTSVKMLALLESSG